MFGGYGIFADGTMFALIDSGGRQFLRVDDASKSSFWGAHIGLYRPYPHSAVFAGI